MYDRFIRPVLVVVLFPWILACVLIALVIILAHCLTAWMVVRFGSEATRAKRGVRWHWLIRSCETMLRWGMYPLLGIRCRVDVAGLTRPLLRGERIVFLCQHPSWAGFPAMFEAMTRCFPAPRSGVFKDALRDWPVGKAFEALGAVCFIPRENRTESIARISAWARTMQEGTLYIFVDGHRPTLKRIKAAQQALLKAGFPELAIAVRTALPKTGGSGMGLTAVPLETRVVCGFFTGSKHEEGFFGVLRLVFGGRYALKIFDASPPPPSDEAAFQTWTNETFVRDGGAWIDAFRGSTHACLPFRQRPHQTPEIAQ